MKEGTIEETVEHYHAERPRQGIGNELIVTSRSGKKPKARAAPEEHPLLESIGCKKRLGGLLKHYYRKAA